MFEWRFGMGLAPAISRDPERIDENGDPRLLTRGDAVCNELVRLAQTLHAIAIMRLQTDPEFRERVANDPPMIMTRSQVAFSMRRVLREMRENDKDGSGLFFSLRPRSTSDRSAPRPVEAKIRTLLRDVQRARRLAMAGVGQVVQAQKIQPRGGR
jgi:hypothetical protein